ncbi:MAG TPA: ROK family protein [Acidimicrobiales bacterium]|nr:ROK family protein [Acidimicrobiales bacterium]
MSIGLGLDVGGTKILGIGMSQSGERVAEVRVDSPHDRDDLLDALEAAVDGLLEVLGDVAREVVSVGVGFPGLVEVDAGVLHAVPNLPAAQGFTVRDDLLPRLVKLAANRGNQPLRLTLDNDATCAAAAELCFGAARSTREAVIVTVGTGIGGGLISGGKVLRGARGFAGEVGHAVIQIDGPPCGCGGRGCWEQFASGSGLARLARLEVAEGRLAAVLERAGSIEAVHGEHVLAAAREGDVEAAALFARVGRYLAVGLHNLAEIFDPDVILLSGGLVRAGDYLVGPTLEAYARYSRRAVGVGAVPVLVAELGDHSGAVGAAAIGLGLVG